MFTIVEQEAEIMSHLCRDSRKSKVEVGQGYKEPKPSQRNSARLNFLQCHCLPKQRHQQRTKCSNTRDIKRIEKIVLLGPLYSFEERVVINPSLVPLRSFLTPILKCSFFHILPHHFYHPRLTLLRTGHHDALEPPNL